MFDEADIELQAENILITDGGLLQIGQEGAPFQHKAIITLHGNLRSPELPVYGTKTLAVREGLLDLHGRKICSTDKYLYCEYFTWKHEAVVVLYQCRS